MPPPAGTQPPGLAALQRVANPVGDSNPCPRIGVIGDRQGRDAGAGPRQEGPQTANSLRDRTAGGTAPSFPGRRSQWPDPEVSDSKLARRIPRSQPLPRDLLAGEHERKRLRPKTVELSPGSTSWRHGDLRPVLRHEYPDRGVIRSDRSTTCAPDGMLAKDRVRSKGRRVQWEIVPRGQEPDVP